MSLIKKAVFAGARGRGALRRMVGSAVDAQRKTGLEHGFHAGKAGVDTKLERGGAKGIRWSARASVGQMTTGGALHHSHPKGHGQLSPQDLRSVVTSPNPKGGRNTLWAHSEDGHEAAKLTRRAAEKPTAFRAKAFARAYRSTKGQGLNALRLKLKRYGLIHSASTVRVKKAAGMIKPGKPPLLHRLGFLLSAQRDDRKYAVGRYLTSRKKGARLLGTLRRRTGVYTNVYKARRSGVRGGEPTIHRGMLIMKPPREPFRTSHRGGSRDLMEAARAKLSGVSPKYRGKRDGDLNNDGRPDGAGKTRPMSEIPGIIHKPDSLRANFTPLKAAPIRDRIVSLGAKRRIARDANIALEQVHMFRTGDNEWTAWRRKGEKRKPFKDEPMLPAHSAGAPATSVRPKRDTSIRAKLMRRVERAPKDVPRNQIPEGVPVSAARPAKADAVKVKATLATRDEQVTTAWGANLKARAGKDMIVQNVADPKDRWVVRRDIYDATYKTNDDGTASKDPKQVLGFWVAPKAMTIETLEGPVAAAAGDHVMIGAVGEMWPVKPDVYGKRYKAVRLRKSALNAYELDVAIAKARGMISRGSSRLVDYARARADHFTDRFMTRRGKQVWRRSDGATVDGVDPKLLRRAVRYETIADKLALRARGGLRMMPAGRGRVRWLRRTGAYR